MTFYSAQSPIEQQSDQLADNTMATQDKTTIMEQTSNLRLTGNPEEPSAHLSKAPYGKQVAVFLESNITTTTPAPPQNNHLNQPANKINTASGGAALPMSSVYQKFNGKSAIENKQT